MTSIKRQSWEDFQKSLFSEYLINPFDNRYRLIPELIPSTSWFENARKHFEKEWPNLKKQCYVNAKYRCEICGGKGPTHPVEAHEYWIYNEKENIQVLEDLCSLCPACHRVKHAGLWGLVKNRWDLVIPHMMKINHISQEEAVVLLEAHFAIHSYRSQVKWSVDMSALKNYGIKSNKFIFKQ